MGFWDDIRVVACPHKRWLDDEPDDMGRRTCAVCEVSVTVTLTEKLMKHTINQASKQVGYAVPYPEIY